MKRAAVLAALLLATAACGGGEAKEPTHHAAGPSWTDVFTSLPDIYAVVRPQALKADKTYGSFWRALVQAAEARGLAHGTTMMEALDGATEIVVGVNHDEAVVVMTGVPARLDPASIQGENGQPLFKAVSDDRKKVAEYTLQDGKHSDGALFALPDRTWVGTLGKSRDRARAAFAAPMNQPEPTVNQKALVSVRVSGGFMHLFERISLVAPLYKKLNYVTLELAPGRGGATVALSYSEADATAYGEMQAKKITADLASRGKDRDWLKSAKIQYEGNVVFCHFDLPPRLLDELPNTKGEDLGL